MLILNENLYNKLRHAGLQCLELPTQHVNLVSAFNEKSKRLRKQALLEINIGGTKNKWYCCQLNCSLKQSWD